MTSTLPFTEEEDLASTDVLGVPAAAHITLSLPAYLETAAYGLQLYIPETHTTVSCQWHNAVLRRTCTVVSKTLMKLQTGRGSVATCSRMQPMQISQVSTCNLSLQKKYLSCAR